MSEQYLMILQESLKKKINVLDEIIRLSKRQADVLSKEPVAYDEFDKCVDDKDICIEQIESLDKGFESIYQKVKQELADNGGKYAEWIKECQRLIAEVTEKSVEIQALESRNKQAVEEAMRKERRGFRQGRRSVEVAKSYYRNMSHTNVVPPQFMDRKK